MWTLPVTAETLYLDTANATRVKQSSSLWAIGNLVIAAGADLGFTATAAVQAGQLLPEFSKSRQYHYVQDHAGGVLYDSYTVSLDKLVKRAYDRLDVVKVILIILLILEPFMQAFGVTLLCVAYNWVLVHNLARHHMLLFTLFLAMPSALIRSMASRPCTVDEEDAAGDEDDEDDYTAQLLESASRKQTGDGAASGKQVRMSAPGGDDKPGKASAGKKAVSKMEAGSSGKKGGRLKFWSLMRRMTGTWGKEARSSFKVSGRRLLPSRCMEVKSMAMFVCFQLLLVLIYGLCFQRLEGLESPISQLNSAQHIVYRASRTRFFAVNLVFSETAAEKAKWRANLARSCSKLQEEFDVLLYGGMLEWLSTTTRSEFLKSSPAVVFEKAATSELFFSTKDCLRADPSSCFPPGHEYYEVTHTGINAMMQRYLQECRLLQLDADADVNPNSSRYKYMYYVGGKDLYEATQALAYSITKDTIAAYAEMKKLNVALLALTIVLPVLYLVFAFRPMLALIRQHTAKVAGLLSQLPPEVDVESRLRAAIDHNKRIKGEQQQDGGDDLDKE